MFQRMIYELFQGLPIVFGIADDIITAGFNDMGREHDATLDKVLQICRQTNQNLNIDKCMFRCTSIPFFVEVILQSSVSPDPRNVHQEGKISLKRQEHHDWSFDMALLMTF